MQGIRPGYRPALDGVRAIAVLAVIGLHTWPEALPGGWVGVDVFFVLSGFLVTSLLLRERESTGGIRLTAFLMRRARRLMPAFLVCIAVAVPVVAVVAAPYAAHDTVAAVLPAVTYQANFAVAGGHSLAALGHIWSLAEEEQFYLVWPAVLVVALRWGGRRPALLVAGVATTASLGAWAILLAAGASTSRLLYSPDTRGLGLLMGVLLALAGEGWRPTRLSTVVGWTALAILALLPTTTLAPIRVIPGCLASVVVVAAARHGGAPLTWRPLVALGRVSYGVYLWQNPAGWLLPIAGLSQGPVLALSATAIAVIIAAGSYRYIEQPIIRGRTRMVASAVAPLPATA